MVICIMCTLSELPSETAEPTACVVSADSATHATEDYKYKTISCSFRTNTVIKMAPDKPIKMVNKYVPSSIGTRLR